MPRSTIAVLKRALTALIMTTLVACNGNGDGVFDEVSNGSDTRTLIVSPSLGLIVGASVTATTTDGEALTETPVVTGDEGTASLAIPADHDAPLIVIVQGAAGATYFDEALGTTVPFPADARLRAFLSGPRDAVGVHALTEFAAALIEGNGGAVTAALIDDANERIRAALAADVDDLLTPPLIVGADLAPGSLEDTPGARIAARLAALAELAPTDASPALTVARQLARDLADGVIDGSGSDGAIAELAYAVASFAAEVAERVAAFANTFGNTALQQTLADARPNLTPGLPPISSGGSGGDVDGSDDVGPLGDTEPAAVAAALVGSYRLEYAQSAMGGPFEDAEIVTAVIGTGGALEIAGKTLVDPFYRLFSGAPNTAEIIWFDPVDSIEYALTDNDTAIFNEINVGDASQPEPFGDTEVPTFLGQLIKAEASGLVITGDGAALDGSDGATGTLDGSVYTFTNDVGLLVSNNTLIFNAFGGSGVEKWALEGVPATVGTHTCPGLGEVPRVLLATGGFPIQATECLIEISSVTNESIEGRFAAVMVNGSEDPAGTVTDGYFRKTAPSSGGDDSGNIPEGEFGTLFDVGGERVGTTSAAGSVGTHALSITGTGTDRFLELGNVGASGANTARIRLIPIATTGTFTCGEGPNSFRLVEMFVNAGGSHTANANTPGSSCTIEVTRTGDVYEGTFEGTLISGDSSITVTNGMFRNDGKDL